METKSKNDENFTRQLFGVGGLGQVHYFSSQISRTHSIFMAFDTFFFYCTAFFVTRRLGGAGRWGEANISESVRS